MKRAEERALFVVFGLALGMVLDASAAAWLGVGIIVALVATARAARR